MSLDVYLNTEPKERKCICSCGNEHTVSEPERVYDANITHNLGKMAEAAGIYKHLWRPEEIGITKAGELIQPLFEGIKKLKADPTHYKKFDAANGWGTYNLPWVERYWRACVENP